MRRRAIRAIPYSRTSTSRPPAASSSHCQTGIRPLLMARQVAHELLTLAARSEAPRNGSGGLFDSPDVRRGPTVGLGRGVVVLPGRLGPLEIVARLLQVDLVRHLGPLGEV